MSEFYQNRLRDHFPTNQLEANRFGVDMYDNLTVFKVFEPDESVETGNRLAEVVSRINQFLETNGYEPIPFDEIDQDAEYNYDAPSGLVSLGKHGYENSLVLFIKSNTQ